MPDYLVGVVGPCGAGKSTLVDGLRLHGFRAKTIAQEHSYVQDMWLRITHPEFLVFLDVSYPLTVTRRSLDWTLSEYEIQLQRLIHARQHADIYIHTDLLTIPEVLNQVLQQLPAVEPPARR